MKHKYTDRYEALGIPQPNVNTMCKGQCEGTGVVPVHKEDKNDSKGDWHTLWLAAEKVKQTADGYHFVKCPTCKGTGKALK